MDILGKSAAPLGIEKNGKTPVGNSRVIYLLLLSQDVNFLLRENVKF